MRNIKLKVFKNDKIIIITVIKAFILTNIAGMVKIVIIISYNGYNGSKWLKVLS